MIVKDLLDQCTDENVLFVLDQMPVSNVEVTKEDFLHGCDSILKHLRTVTPKEANFVFLVEPYECGNQERIGLVLYTADKIKTEFRLNARLDEAIDTYDPSRLGQFVASLNDLPDPTEFIPTAESEEYGHWDEMLGYQIEEEDVEIFGAEQILAQIVNDIARWGFDERSIRKVFEEIDAEFDDDCLIVVRHRGEPSTRISFPATEGEPEAQIEINTDIFAYQIQLFLFLLSKYQIIRDYYCRHFGCDAE